MAVCRVFYAIRVRPASKSPSATVRLRSIDVSGSHVCGTAAATVPPRNYSARHDCEKGIVSHSDGSRSETGPEGRVQPRGGCGANVGASSTRSGFSPSAFSVRVPMEHSVMGPPERYCGNVPDLLGGWQLDPGGWWDCEKPPHHALARDRRFQHALCVAPRSGLPGERYPAQMRGEERDDEMQAPESRRQR
ncbi:hypothetical protein C8Q77DRAFT_687435 [Trametes polyzona]|nr:hypothetical protein C8Q77DRAFT_687435 [Trametes polyzona]